MHFYKALDDSEVDRVIEKFTSIQSKRSGEKIQGPYLAKIELSTRRKLIEKSKQFIRDYADTFASKPGFVFDLDHFAPAIRDLQLTDFLVDDVLKPLYEANKPPFTSIKSIYTCLSYFQCKRVFSTKSERSEVDLLESLYVNALDAFGRDLLPTAYQYADDFLLLAIYARLDNSNGEEDDALVLRIIANLRLGLVYSPSSHQFKLLLINLYSHLGAYDALYSTYESMEIKNIQNYSISYLTLTQNMRLAAASASTGSTIAAYNFFTSNLFDLANFLVNCFKFGTFVKIIEFIEFSDSVRESFAFALCCAVYASGAIFVGAEPEPVNLSSGAQTTTTSANVNTSSSDEEMRSYLGLIGAKLAKFVRENAGSSRAFDLGLLLAGNERTGLVDHNDAQILYEWESSDRKVQIDAAYHQLIDEQCFLIKLRFLMAHYLSGKYKTC